MITVQRGELLEAKTAIENLGKVFIPVGKEKYWFIKSLSKIQKALKKANQDAQNQSNKLVNDLGTKKADGRVGIDSTDEDNMKTYTQGMEDFMELPVNIECKQLTLTELASAQVTLTANDQIALMWLISEE